ncbi:hypothetical protein [Hoyosella subflava]|uniref:Uncharacterized protein n=1 Tax=Hoyosella subflava (strain DSM 45089 / JCM 17490 / NBRC 109087 / DQS3-9A1) TaxID=443218 RepID=F6ENF5_HOYSD|nr:hypothetical protein [Hoyosella subflava]AEF40426.1 hypothetical protein AS9A_1977 [Hoyosella subflava DQS3-9A1]
MSDLAVNPASLERARAVADAVLYEGYLLYPYRADSRKNQTRWQFGVLGPPGAAERFAGEESHLSAQCLVRCGSDAKIGVSVRFLQLQRREVEELREGRFVSVPEMTVGQQRYLAWDEAVAHDVDLGDLALRSPHAVVTEVSGAEVVEMLTDNGDIAGRVRRTRWPLRAELSVHATGVSDLLTVNVAVRNTSTTTGSSDPKTDAIRSSLLGAHVILTCANAEFVSLLEPGERTDDTEKAADEVRAASSCVHHRCFPVLAGLPGERHIVLISPIILYDYPEIAGESSGPMFDATEIDEILTLRVMAMTEDEKAMARATDPLAAEIIDRADQSTADSLGALHGTIRNGSNDRSAGLDHVPVFTEPGEDKPWWDPAVDSRVDPETDTVTICGVSVGKGSLVRVHPCRSADAQDLFFRDQVARVTMVHTDVDGGTHIGVVLVDDPAADLHDWFGRYLYFAPSELEPLGADGTSPRKESAS